MRPRRIYDHPAWKPARRLVLERDRHQCQIRGPKCTTVATDVDHIVPPEDGGAPFDPANLRSSCHPCNSGRSARIASRRRRVTATGTTAAPSRQW